MSLSMTMILTEPLFFVLHPLQPGKTLCFNIHYNVIDSSAFLISANTLGMIKDILHMCSFTRFASNRHSPMSSERREVVGEGGSSGKSTPNWSRMEEGGERAERGSTGKFILEGS